MKNQSSRFYEKSFFISISFVLAGLGSSANAQLITQDSDTVSFQGVVPLECALINAGLTNQSQPGNYLTLNPLDVTTGVGSNANAVGGDTTRYRFISAQDSSAFDCNSDNVSATITLSSINAPRNFTHATNLDFVTGAGQTGFDHSIGIRILRPSLNVNQSVGTFVARNNGQVIYGPQPRQADTNGDISFNVTSTFQTVNGAEELASGNYSATILVSVTAQ